MKDGMIACGYCGEDPKTQTIIIDIYENKKSYYVFCPNYEYCKESPIVHSEKSLTDAKNEWNKIA